MNENIQFVARLPTELIKNRQVHSRIPTSKNNDGLCYIQLPFQVLFCLVEGNACIENVNLQESATSFPRSHMQESVEKNKQATSGKSPSPFLSVREKSSDARKQNSFSKAMSLCISFKITVTISFKKISKMLLYSITIKHNLVPRSLVDEAEGEI